MSLQILFVSCLKIKKLMGKYMEKFGINQTSFHFFLANFFFGAVVAPFSSCTLIKSRQF